MWGTVLVPAHYQDNWVTVEDLGWNPDAGQWQQQYEWQVVSSEYYPPIFDESGIMLFDGYYDYHYDWVYTGETWVVTGAYEVIGTHSENQPVWVDDSYEPFQDVAYSAPVIHQKASRSDANWTWEVPTEGGGTKVALRLWNGGLSLPRLDGNIGMSLTPGALIYTLGNTTTQVGAGVTTYVTQVTEGGTAAESKNEVRPELVRLTRTETTSGTTTTGMTQIAAKSASFGGVVTVQGNLQAQGNLQVQGVLRIAAGGDLSMGEFTTSPEGASPP